MTSNVKQYLSRSYHRCRAFLHDDSCRCQHSLARFSTLVYSWEIQRAMLRIIFVGKRSMPAIKQYLHIAHGVPGILLGLITPLVLWAVAIYIALGSKKIDANT